MHDLVIRGGTVVDGTGAARRVADIAVDVATITKVGPGIGPARREIDATGLLVTPGFVDVHTHYDGQATWDPYLTPSPGTASPPWSSAIAASVSPPYVRAHPLT